MKTSSLFLPLAILMNLFTLDLAAQWANYGADSKNSSCSLTNQSPIDSPSLLWEFESKKEFITSPSISEGLAIFGSQLGYVYAIDIASGQEKWKFKTGTNSTVPSISDGVVYFGGLDSCIYAVDVISGQEKWKFKTGNCIYSPSPAIVNGIAFIGSTDGYLYAVDTKTGKEKWKFKTGGSIWSSPAVENNIVYFGSYDQNLYAVDIQSGQEKWKFRAKYSIGNSPVISSGVVAFIAGNGEYLYALDIKNGLVKWELKLGHASKKPAIDGGVVFIFNEGYLNALRISTGNQIWKTKIFPNVTSNPIVADNGVFLGTQSINGYEVIVFNKETGKENWRIKTKFGLINSISIAYKTMFLSTPNTLCAFK